MRGRSALNCLCGERRADRHKEEGGLWGGSICLARQLQERGTRGQEGRAEGRGGRLGSQDGAAGGPQVEEARRESAGPRQGNPERVSGEPRRTGGRDGTEEGGGVARTP